MPAARRVAATPLSVASGPRVLPDGNHLPVGGRRMILAALAAGASENEVAAVLLAIAPVAGPAASPEAPDVATALVCDIATVLAKPGGTSGSAEPRDRLGA